MGEVVMTAKVSVSKEQIVQEIKGVPEEYLPQSTSDCSIVPRERSIKAR